MNIKINPPAGLYKVLDICNKQLETDGDSRQWLSLKRDTIDAIVEHLEIQYEIVNQALYMTSEDEVSYNRVNEDQKRQLSMVIDKLLSERPD